MNDLDSLRKRVAAEPRDKRGKLARELMAWIDARLAKDEELAHKRGVEHFLSDGVTPEEAEKLWAQLVSGKMPETEEGPCRTCDGSGQAVTSTGCMGGHYSRCPKCRGTGTDKKRWKIP